MTTTNVSFEYDWNRDGTTDTVTLSIPDEQHDATKITGELTVNLNGEVPAEERLYQHKFTLSLPSLEKQDCSIGWHLVSAQFSGDSLRIVGNRGDEGTQPMIATLTDIGTKVYIGQQEPMRSYLGADRCLRIPKFEGGGDPNGVDGLATRGSGLGAGSSAGSLGGLGTKGREDDLSSYGTGGRPFGADGDYKIGTIGGEPAEAEDALTRDEVTEVLDRNLQQINGVLQWANQQLANRTKVGDLELKGEIELTIGPDGMPTEAKFKISRINHSELREELESKIAARLMKMHFPCPRGGGLVHFKGYPITFAIL